MYYANYHGFYRPVVLSSKTVSCDQDTLPSVVVFVTTVVVSWNEHRTWSQDTQG